MLAYRPFRRGGPPVPAAVPPVRHFVAGVSGNAGPRLMWSPGRGSRTCDRNWPGRLRRLGPPRCCRWSRHCSGNVWGPSLRSEGPTIFRLCAARQELQFATPGMPGDPEHPERIALSGPSARTRMWPGVSFVPPRFSASSEWTMRRRMPENSGRTSGINSCRKGRSSRPTGLRHNADTPGTAGPRTPQRVLDQQGVASPRPAHRHRKTVGGHHISNGRNERARP